MKQTTLLLTFLYCYATISSMTKRGEPFKQITVSLSTFKRFIAYGEYQRNNEGILLMLMDEANKYRRSAHKPIPNGYKENTNGEKTDETDSPKT